MNRTFDRIPSVGVPVEAHHVRTLVAGLAPRSYTWSVSQHLDQGQLGACVGFGFTHDAIARPKPHKNLGYDDAVALYYQAQDLNGQAHDPEAGTSVAAGAKASQSHDWLKQYRWATSVDDVVLAIGRVGPVVIGVNWYSGMMDTDAKHFIHPIGSVEGGHCTLLKGVSLPKKRFTVHQSWGTGWGLNGDAYLSFEDLGLLLSQQGEAVVPVVKD